MSQGVQQFHTYDLTVMPEDDLNRALRQAQEQLGSMRREGTSEGMRQYAEVEVCYLQRETEVRTKRRSAHDRWIRSRPDHDAAAPHGRRR